MHFTVHYTPAGSKDSELVADHQATRDAAMEAAAIHSETLTNWTPLLGGNAVRVATHGQYAITKIKD